MTRQPILDLPWASYARCPSKEAPFPLQVSRGCPLTGSCQEEELLVIDDFQFFSDQDGINRIQHRVVYNTESGMLYTNPCYTPQGFTLLFEKAGQSYGHSAGRLEEQVDWIYRHIHHVSSVCDIGCGTGAFLNTMPKTVTRMGVDIDGPSIEKARQTASDIRFILADFEHFTMDEPVHLFTMFHVLEHLPNPLQVLRHLRRIARQNTQLLVEVPVLERAVAEPVEDLVGFMTVQHLTHFSQTTLQTMLLHAGWLPQITECIPGYNGFRLLASPAESDTRPVPEKDRLHDRQLAHAYTTMWQNNVTRVQKRIGTLRFDAGSPILIWGGGMHLEYLDRLTSLFRPGPRYLIVDRDPSKTGTRCHGIPVLQPEAIPDTLWQNPHLQVVISSYAWQDDIYNTLLEKGVNPDAVKRLYDEIRRY